MNSADRLLRVLQGFTAEKPMRTIPDLAEELEVSLVTAYRYVKSLQKAGLLESLHGEGFTLGPAIIELDRMMRLTDPLLSAARPEMRSLAARTGALILLCRTYRDRVVCIQDEVGADAPRQVNYERGRAVPLFKGAASKVILAYMPLRRVQRLAELHRSELAGSGLPSGKAALAAALKRIKREKVVVRSGELDPEIVGLAAAILDGKRVIGSLAVVLDGDSATAQVIERCKPLLLSAVSEIEASMAPQPVSKPLKPLKQPKPRKRPSARAAKT